MPRLKSGDLGGAKPAGPSGGWGIAGTPFIPDSASDVIHTYSHLRLGGAARTCRHPRCGARRAPSDNPAGPQLSSDLRLGPKARCDPTLPGTARRNTPRLGGDGVAHHDLLYLWSVNPRIIGRPAGRSVSSAGACDSPARFVPCGVRRSLVSNKDRSRRSPTAWSTRPM